MASGVSQRSRHAPTTVWRFNTSGLRQKLNFPEGQTIAHILVPEDMRVATRAKDMEHRQDERELYDPLVERIVRSEPGVLENNRRVLGSFGAGSSGAGSSGVGPSGAGSSVGAYQQEDDWFSDNGDDGVDFFASVDWKGLEAEED